MWDIASHQAKRIRRRGVRQRLGWDGPPAADARSTAHRAQPTSPLSAPPTQTMTSPTVAVGKAHWREAASSRLRRSTGSRSLENAHPPWSYTRERSTVAPWATARSRRRHAEGGVAERRCAARQHGRLSTIRRGSSLMVRTGGASRCIDPAIRSRQIPARVARTSPSARMESTAMRTVISVSPVALANVRRPIGRSRSRNSNWWRTASARVAEASPGGVTGEVYRMRGERVAPGA